MKKTILVLTLLCTFAALPEHLPADKARGLFLAVGVGPRIPVGDFGNASDMGYGVNFEISYTDNEYLPLFLFARAGYETFPGSQSFYQQSDYSNYSTNAFPLNAGVRYYFKPLIQSIVLIMPIVEASFQYTYYQKLHQFKPTSGRFNFSEESSKIGLSIGAGFSMFMLEIMANYSYFQTNQYFSADLKVRLPIFINL